MVSPQGFCAHYFGGTLCAPTLLAARIDAPPVDDAAVLAVYLQAFLLDDVLHLPDDPALYVLFGWTPARNCLPTLSLRSAAGSRSAHPFALLRVVPAAFLHAALAAQMDAPPTAVSLERVLAFVSAVVATPTLALVVVPGLVALVEDWAVASSCWTRKDAGSDGVPIPLLLTAHILQSDAAPLGLLHAAGPAILRALLTGPQTPAVADIVRFIRDALGPASSVTGTRGSGHGEGGPQRSLTGTRASVVVAVGGDNSRRERLAAGAGAQASAVPHPARGAGRRGGRSGIRERRRSIWRRRRCGRGARRG